MHFTHTGTQPAHGGPGVHLTSALTVRAHDDGPGVPTGGPGVRTGGPEVHESQKGHGHPVLGNTQKGLEVQGGDPGVLTGHAGAATDPQGVRGDGPGVRGEGPGVQGDGPGVRGDGPEVREEGPGVRGDSPGVPEHSHANTAAALWAAPRQSTQLRMAGA